MNWSKHKWQPVCIEQRIEMHKTMNGRKWEQKELKPETLSEPYYEKWTHARYVPFIYWNTSWFCVYVCVFFFKYMDGSIFWCILFHFSPSNLLEVYLMVVAFSPRVWRRKLNNQEYERTKNGKQDCGICYIWCEIIKVEKE